MARSITGSSERPTPDWSLWQALPKVKVWQAVALSLDLDPDAMTTAPHGWMAGAGGLLRFAPESFVSQKQAAEFDKRRRIAAANLGRDADDDRAEGPLSDFLDVAVLLGWRVPFGLQPALELRTQIAEAAAPDELRPYALRERLSLFELACLLHGASPERVSRIAWQGVSAHDSEVSGRHESPSPEKVRALMDATPEMILGPRIGGTLKALRVAAGAGSMNDAVTLDTAGRLARGLGLALPEAIAPVRVVVAQGERPRPGKVLRLPANTMQVRFDELEHLIIEATWPGDESGRREALRIELEEELPRAVHDRALTVRSPISLAPHTYPHGRSLREAMVDVEDLRAWLQDTRRMSVEVAEADADAVGPAAPVAERGEGEPNRADLATADELIAAFGSFTGMDKAWFSKLGDTPKLLAARKVRGTGQRGARQPAMFCPFEVMLWLIDGNRKKGAKMSEHTGWRRLRECFQRVYVKHSAASPLEG